MSIIFTFFLFLLPNRLELAQCLEILGLFRKFSEVITHLYKKLNDWNI